MDRGTEYETGTERGLIADVLLAAPILAAILASIIYTGWSIGARLTKPYPLNPWESAIVADAYRAAHGRAVYEQFPEGHATHLYGAFSTYFLGGLFKLTGANFVTGRLVNLISGFAVCALLIHIFLKRKGWLELFIATGLMVALHYRCRAYFTETRPDVIAFFIAAVGVVLSYRALTGDKIAWIVPGSVLIATAMMFKQTYAAAALVPPLALILLGDWRDLKRMTFSAIPLIAVGLTGVILWKAFPLIYYYMFKVPSQYNVPKERIYDATAKIVTLCPIFFASAMVLALTATRRFSSNTKLVWLTAAIVIGSLAGVIAMAKRGGSYNSLLLGWGPMTAFCVYAISPIMDMLRNSATSLLIRFGGSAIAGILIAATTFAVPNNDLWAFEGAHGHSMYLDVITSLKKRLGDEFAGTMVCPDDPCLMMFVLGEPSRSLDCDLDADGRNKPMPDVVSSYLASADWVVRVHCNYDDFFVDEKRGPDRLEQLGFTRQIDPVLKRYYSLWKRTGEPSFPTSQPSINRRVNRS